MNEKQEVTVFEKDGEALVFPVEKISRLLKPHVPNRAERRRMQRSAGYRGKKSKRNTRGPQDAQEAAEAQLAIESQEKTVEAARNLRDLTGGRMWLPGDK